MKVEFARSGGFANIPLTVTLDTASMPAAMAKDLEGKIAAADFFHLPGTIGDNAELRDAQRYTVTVTTPERRHTVAVTEGAPPALQALVDHLVVAAKQARSTR